VGVVVGVVAVVVAVSVVVKGVNGVSPTGLKPSPGSRISGPAWDV
jgi:hypothetical protein